MQKTGEGCSDSEEIYVRGSQFEGMCRVAIVIAFVGGIER